MREAVRFCSHLGTSSTNPTVSASSSKSASGTAPSIPHWVAELVATMAASVFSDEGIWGRDSDCGGGEQDHHEDKVYMRAADDEDEEYQRGYEEAMYEAQ